MLNKIIEQWLGNEQMHTVPSEYIADGKPHETEYDKGHNALIRDLKSRIPELEEIILGEIEKMKERLADLEHDRWSKWQKYMHGHVYDSSQSINPHLKVIPTELYNRWEKQIVTPYSELSEKEKDSDRIEAQNTIDTIINSLKGDKE